MHNHSEQPDVLSMRLCKWCSKRDRAFDKPYCKECLREKMDEVSSVIEAEGQRIITKHRLRVCRED